MKNLLFIIICFIAAFVCSCQNNSKQSEIDEINAIEDSLAKINYGVGMYDSLVKEIDKDKKSGGMDINPEEFGKSIKILKYYTSKPNSAGGVDMHIVFKNISKKVIKYATFTFVPYNAVDDIVESEIGGKSASTIQATGPLKAGQTFGWGWSWRNLWYNSTIKYASLTQIEIIFMDGSKIFTANSELIKKLK